MTVTTIPAGPDWRLVTAARPDGADLQTVLRPVLGWVMDDATPVGAVVVSAGGLLHTISGGRYVNPVGQHPSDYQQALRLALDDFRRGEAADLAEMVGPVGSDALAQNLGATTATPGGPPGLSQQSGREGPA